MKPGEQGEAETRRKVEDSDEDMKRIKSARLRVG